MIRITADGRDRTYLYQTLTSVGPNVGFSVGLRVGFNVGDSVGFKLGYPSGFHPSSDNDNSRILAEQL